jgi:thiamine transport system substrate-binding protein
MRNRPIALLLAAALAVSACGDDDTTASTDPTTAGEEQEASSIRLVTHDSFDVSEEVLEAFTEETGITVELLASGDAGSMVNQAILTKGRPQGDVLFGIDSTFLSRALDEDLFIAYESPALAAVDEALVLDPEHRVTPIDTGDVCLNYDRTGLTDAGLEPPQSLADLADPAYAGTLVVQNPATSSPGLAYLLATIAEFGEDGWQDHWRDLRDNDVEVASGWSEAYYGSFSGAAGSPGDRPIVVSYASSPPAEVIFAEEPLDEGLLREDHLSGTEREVEARQLIDFMLSETFQSDIPLNMFVYPVIDVELPPEFVEHGAQPDEPYLLDPETVAANRDAWIEEWTEIVLR